MSDAAAREQRARDRAHGYASAKLDALNVSGGLVTESPKWQAALERVQQRRQRRRRRRLRRPALARREDRASPGSTSSRPAGGIVISRRAPHRRHATRTSAPRSSRSSTWASCSSTSSRKRSPRDDARPCRRRGITQPRAVRLHAQPAAGRDADRARRGPEEARPRPGRRRGSSSGSSRCASTARSGPRSRRGSRPRAFRRRPAVPVWTTSTLSTLVGNRIYLGEVKMGKVVTRGAHEPLVTPRTFDEAQPRGRGDPHRAATCRASPAGCWSARRAGGS